MKTSIITLFLLLASFCLSAQEFKIPVQNIKEGRLILKDFSNLLPVEGYNGSEIIITSSDGDFTPPAKAKGLKPVFPAGTDNTGLGLEVARTDNLITVNCLLPLGRNAGYKLKVPENLAIEIRSECERDNPISVKDMKNEIVIESCQNIDLKQVTGPLVLSTISGNINISYSSINTSKASSVNTISGEIDITLPAKTAVDLDMHVVTGGIYSDFDFSESQKNLKKVGGNETSIALNGGGFKYTINNISGNIYLRKGN